MELDWAERMKKMSQVVEMTADEKILEEAGKVAKGYLKMHPDTNNKSAQEIMAIGIVSGRIFERIGKEAWKAAVELGEEEQ